MARRTQQAATLVESLVASLVTVMALGGASAVWLAGATSWYRGAGKINAENQSVMAVKSVCRELAEAMDVTVDPDGQGITFHKPAKDAQGEYQTDITGQPVSDGHDRRIELAGAKLVYDDGTSSRVLATNVILTDPLSADGAAPYKVFTAGAGAITRQLTVMVVTQTTGANTETVKARKRETVFLRNIYDTTR